MVVWVVKCFIFYVKKIVFVVEYDFIMVIYLVDCVIVFDGVLFKNIVVNSF